MRLACLACAAYRFDSMASLVDFWATSGKKELRDGVRKGRINIQWMRRSQLTFELLTTRDDIVDILGHDGVDVAQLGVNFVEVALCAGVAVEFLCFQDERIESDELVGAARVHHLGPVDSEKLAPQLLEIIEREPLGVASLG